MLSSQHTTFKYTQLAQINEYLAKYNIKPLYANLVYHLTLYQPNDPIEFMIQHLRVQRDEKGGIDALLNESTESSTLKRPKVIFLINENFDKESLLGRQLALRFKFYYMQLEALLDKEVYSDSALGKELHSVRQGNYAQWRDNTAIEKAHKMQVLSKEMQLNEDHEDFIVDGFPQTLGEAIWFERDICEPRCIIFIREPRRDTDDEEWKKKQRHVAFLREYYAGRNKWIEVQGEDGERGMDDVIRDIEEMLV